MKIMLHDFVRHDAIINYAYMSFLKNSISEKQNKDICSVCRLFFNRTCYMRFFETFLRFFLKIVVFNFNFFSEKTICNLDTRGLLHLCFYFFSISYMYSNTHILNISCNYKITSVLVTLDAN